MFCAKDSRPKMALCSIPTKVSRDGHTSASGSIYLPFYGRLFFSGAQYSYAGTELPQDKSRSLTGRSLPSAAYTKGYDCGCS